VVYFSCCPSIYLEGLNKMRILSVRITDRRAYHLTACLDVIHKEARQKKNNLILPSFT